MTQSNRKEQGSWRNRDSTGRPGTSHLSGDGDWLKPGQDVSPWGGWTGMARLWGVVDQPYSGVTGAVADDPGANMDPGPATEKTKRNYNHTSQSNPVSCPPLQSGALSGAREGCKFEQALWYHNSRHFASQNF